MAYKLIIFYFKIIQITVSHSRWMWDSHVSRGHSQFTGSLIDIITLSVHMTLRYRVRISISIRRGRSLCIMWRDHTYSHSTYSKIPRRMYFFVVLVLAILHKHNFVSIDICLLCISYMCIKICAQLSLPVLIDLSCQVPVSKNLNNW